MTTRYSGYGYGRATRRERRAQRRRDEVIARYWHSRLTHETCNGQPYCSAHFHGRRRDADAHAYSDHGHEPRRYYTGHLHAPCSRYGRNGDECAWWAIAAAFIRWGANGDAPTWEGLDYDQGLAVNDSDGIAELVWSYWSDVPPYVRARLADGTRASVGALVYDLPALREQYA